MKKKVVFAIIFILIIIVAIGAFAYIRLDAFKSPEQLFKKYILNVGEQIADFNIEPYDEILEKMKTTPVDVSLDLKTANSDVMDSEYKVNYDVKFDPKSENTEVALNIGVDDATAEASVVKTGDLYGIRVKEFHDKYLSLENRDLKKFAEKLSLDQEIIDSIPDKIPEANPLTDEEINTLKELASKYVKNVFKEIDSDNYSVKKDVELTVDEKTVKVDKYTLKIDSVKLGKLILNNMKEFLNDEEFKKICKDRIDDSIIDKAIDNLDEQLDELSDSDNDQKMKVSVYVLKRKTVKLEFEEDGDTVSISIENKEKESSININTVVEKSDTNDVETTYTVTIKNEIDKDSKKLSFEVKTKYNKDDVKALEEEDDDNYYSSFYGSSYEDTSTKVILKAKTDDNVTKVELNITGDEEESFEGVDLSMSFKFDKDLKITEINDDNALILNDYSSSDLEKLGNEILDNLKNSYNNNSKSLIGNLAYYYMMLLQ